MKKILSLKMILLNFAFISASQADVVQKQAVDFSMVKTVINEIDKPAETLLMLDFEDTLVRASCDFEKPTQESCSYMGSKPWFEWQLSLLKNEPKSEYLVAKDKFELIEIYNVLLEEVALTYSEEIIPGLLKEISESDVEIMLVTQFSSLHRYVESKSTELVLNESDKEKVLLSSILSTKSPKLDEPLTALGACNSTEQAKVNYQNGVLYTAGESKSKAIRCFVEQYNAQLNELAKKDDKILEKSKVIAVEDYYDDVSDLYDVYRNHKDRLVYSLHYINPEEMWKPLLADGKEIELQEQSHKKWLKIEEDILKKVYFIPE